MKLLQPRPPGAGSPARRPLPRGLSLAGGLALVSIYFYRTGWVVWPYLFQSGGDFEGYYRAAGEMLARRSPFLDRFDYPPLVAFLVLPLHPLGLDGARVAWFVFSQLCLLGAAFALFRALGADRRAGWTVGILWALAGTIPENLGLGQVHPLLLLLLCLAWRWDAGQPGKAAGAIGLAAGLKIWPGLLLAAYLGRSRRRALGWGIGAVLAALLLPLALIAGLFPRPHLPTQSDYWMGTPASLNFSLPALALRATDPAYRQDAPPPADWDLGNNAEAFDLSRGRSRLSLAVSLGTLALGLLALGACAPERLALLAGLTALATLASPIAWYHYQIFQLPGLALLAVRALRQPSRLRAGAWLAALALLTTGLTRSELRDQLFGGGTAGEVLWGGAAIALLNLLLFSLLVTPPPNPLPSRAGEGGP